MYSKLFDFLMKYRKIIMSVSLFFTIVCFFVFIAFILVGNDMCYIPLLAMFVVGSPKMFYSFIDELEENNK